MRFSPSLAEQHRIACGLTSRRAAGKAVGVTGQAIANIEAGAIPSAETLAAMADAYGVRLEDFYVVHDDEQETTNGAGTAEGRRG